MSPFELSGGQKRRAAIAGVIAMNPKVLILDEPTAGLDPKGRDELFDLIRELHEKMDMTVLLVSHSMEDMANYVQRIVVLNHGTLMLDGTPFRGIFPCARAGTGVIGGPAGDLSDERSGKSRISCGYDSDNDRGSKAKGFIKLC